MTISVEEVDEERCRRARGARHRRAGARRPLRRRTDGRAVPARAHRRRRSGARPTATSSSTTSPSPAAMRSSPSGAGGFTIEDLGSLNGTFLNRSRIEKARARERGRGPDRQVPAHLPRPMTTTTTTHAPRLHTIGSVCRRLQGEFPDISISKIRYLEDQGLLSPKRTRGGYRLFSEEDVERLETILRLQRDEFLPLRVIRQELASPASKERRRRRAGLDEPRPRDRRRGALRARGHLRRAGARADRLRTARAAAHRGRRRHRRRLRPARRRRRGRAPPAQVRHRGREPGRPARGARPEAPLPEPGGPPGRARGPPRARRARPGAQPAAVLAALRQRASA